MGVSDGFSVFAQIINFVIIIYFISFLINIEQITNFDLFISFFGLFISLFANILSIVER